MFTESRPLSLGPVDGFSYRSVLILLKIAWCLTCPYCEADLEIVSPLDHIIFISWRTCPKCRKEFLIKAGKAERSPN